MVPGAISLVSMEVWEFDEAWLQAVTRCLDIVLE
jgi:hypothetical protein